MSATDQAKLRLWIRDGIAIIMFMIGGVSLWHNSEIKHEASKHDRLELHRVIEETKEKDETSTMKVMAEINRHRTLGCDVAIQAAKDVAVIKKDIEYIKQGIGRIEDKLP